MVIMPRQGCNQLLKVGGHATLAKANTMIITDIEDETFSYTLIVQLAMIISTFG